MTMLLTGPQKAAVVLSQSEATRAARILKAMSEQEAVQVLSAMATLPSLTPAQISEVLGEFQELGETQVGVGVAKKLLVERLGSSRAQDVLLHLTSPVHPHPLQFLEKVDAAQIATFISEEHPQTVAVVLAHLPAEQAAMVLGTMDEGRRADVARRVATMQRVYPEALQHIADVLEEQLSALVRSGSAVVTVRGGVNSMVAILNQTDRSSEQQILNELEAADPDLAEEIRNELFVFDDIVKLDDRTLQLILRNVVPHDLAVALKNSPPELRDTFLRNMSTRAAEDLTEEIGLLGPTRLSEVESAQTDIVRIVRQLEASGEIVLARNDDELV